MTHFAPEQVERIHKANEYFNKLMAEGAQGQIIDDTTPERKAQMEKWANMSQEEKDELAAKFIKATLKSSEAEDHGV